MADVNQIITLGIGTPSDIEHFLTFGLSIPIIGFIDLDARTRPIALDVEERVAHTARGSRVALEMDNRDD